MTSWAMPRDMSGYSTLEAAMLAAMNAAGLPQPEHEYRFVQPCCEHGKRRHVADLVGPRLDEAWRCRDCGTEHDYDAGRRWRFDFAWPDLMVAVECEGGTYTGGRHTTGAGFEKDAEKYAEAVARGWTVLRFTQRQITSGAALEALERVLTRVTATEVDGS